MKLIIIAAITAIVLSCNSPKSSTNSDSNFRNSTTDTSTTNHIQNPDSTQHR